MTAPAWLRRIEQLHPFTEQEAWSLFRFIAIAEAVGWTTLIVGIGLQDYVFPHTDFAIPVAGQLHGMIFIAYFGILLFTYSSLSWSRPKALLAAVAGVPPYGTLAFELWAARARRRDLLRQTYRRIIVAGLIISGDTLLAVQPSDSSVWTPPGGPIASGEQPPQAAARVVASLTGVAARVGELRIVRRTVRGQTETLEMYFLITNPTDFTHLTSGAAGVDELKFLEPRATEQFEPPFLRDLPLAELADQRVPVRFL